MDVAESFVQSFRPTGMPIPRNVWDGLGEWDFYQFLGTRWGIRIHSVLSPNPPKVSRYHRTHHGGVNLPGVNWGTVSKPHMEVEGFGVALEFGIILIDLV